MSWARDEWKLDLPTTALKKISELENDAENLRKNKQQQQFQLESVSSSLQKQKQLTSEEKTVNSNLRHEIQELTRKCSELESQEEKTQVDLKAKESKIYLLEEQLRKAREKLQDEEERNSELTKKLDEQQVNAETKDNEIVEFKKELEQMKDAKEQIAKALDAAKQKIEMLCKESGSLRDQLKQRDELLTKHCNQVVEKGAVPMADNDDPTAAVAVGGAFLEILKRENNALISDNEELKAQVDQLKSVLREKEKELERVMEKLSCSHAENETISNELKVKEREIAKLEKKLRNNEDELRKAQERVKILEVMSQQLSEETDDEQRDLDKMKERLECVNNALEDSKIKIRTLETDLTQRTNQVKAKRDRVETLEEENVQLTQELDSLKRQNNAVTETYLGLTTALKEKDLRIKELEDDNKEKKRQLKTQGEKAEVLGLETTRLREELDRAEQMFMDKDQSYQCVSRALEESRKAIKNNLDNIGQALGEADISERLEQRKLMREDGGYQKSRETKSKTCGNCENLKTRLREQEESYTLKIREFEAYIRDLKTEKETLEQKVTCQRRSSEEFTSRVQQIVQKIEIERRTANKQDKEGTEGGQLRETENFFNMVKRFFIEHEALKDNAQDCLRDLHQLQRYFQGCSDEAKEVISHVQTFETVAKRMSLLKSLLESVVEEFARPLNDEESEAEGRENAPIEADIRAEMSWDNYEREVAFNVFKDDVEGILHQLDHGKKMAERKAEELREIKRAHLALKKVRKRSRQAIERVLAQGDIEELGEVRLRENDLNGSQKRGTRMDSADLIDAIKNLLSQNREELECKMGQHFERLENTINHQRAQQCQGDKRQQTSAENFKDTIDGKFAIGELDLVKRRLSDVQKSIKHLIGSLSETDKEKKAAESKMDLLNVELTRKESQYEAKCDDLKKAAKAASEHEVSLRGRIDGLTSEKDEINSELRRVVGVLKKKELELVEKSQELKHLQAEFKEEQRVLKNKMAALEQENDGLWLDYKEADKRAEIKEKEFKELADRLKTSQGYLHNMFNSLSNMDDELQKARDIQVYSQQD